MKKKYSILLFILLCLCSLPALWNKIETEHSANTVEFSTDYFSLLLLSKQSDEPELFLNAMLKALQDEDFTTITLPNNTFALLEERGIVSVLSAHELSSIELLSQQTASFDRNLTYVLLLDKSTEKELTTMIQKRFVTQRIEKKDVNGQTIMGIDLPMAKLLNVSIPYLEQDIQFLTQKPYDFSLTLKMDNKWQGNEEVAIEQLQSMATKNISSIYFTDNGVLGYPERQLDFMKEFPDVSFAYKEFFSQEEKQKGIDELAKEKDYNINRLHAIPENIFVSNFETPEILVERITKAVSERNIRTFHFQFPREMDEKTGKNIFVSSFSVLKTAKDELTKQGYSFGDSHPFTQNKNLVFVISQWCAVFAGILLISFAVKALFPKWTTLSVIVLSIFALSSVKIGTLPLKMIALAMAISIPLVVAHWILSVQTNKRSSSLKSTVLLFLGVSAFSVGGGLLLGAMHASIPHLLYFEPFRGVSLAHLVPPFIVLCLMLKWEDLLHKDTLLKVAGEPVRIYQVLVLGVIGFFGIYYLSRTGNTGTLLPFEDQMRLFLDNTLGVRPRTKEFLLAHPLMIVILYYWQKHKWLKWALPIAIVGQLSMVNTFTHFHTPVLISLWRSGLGLGLGLFIGLLIIGLIESIKWLKKKKQLHEKE